MSEGISKAIWRAVAKIETILTIVVNGTERYATRPTDLGDDFRSRQSEYYYYAFSKKNFSLTRSRQVVQNVSAHSRIGPAEL
jgi:hypothetical protein